MPDSATGLPASPNPFPVALREGVDHALAAFVAHQRAVLAPLGPDLDALVDAASQAVSGGKRLRPVFAYWGWRAAAGSHADIDGLLTAAAAIELVHAGALVHDDVMDASATRRGGPAAHIAFAALRPIAAPGGLPERFGTNAAILLGDLLLVWSDEMFASARVKSKAMRAGRVYFEKLRTEVMAGQYLDILAARRLRSTGPDAMRVLRYKSAKYTVERPLQIGAALGKADERLLSALSAYGVPVGEAFQLRDDMLGVFGDPDVTGKPSGDDVREGKRTLLMARAFDMADPAQRAVLDAAFGNADLDDAALADVQQVLRDCGAVRAVETVITELTAAALLPLRAATFADPAAKQALIRLSAHATERSS